jgi:hypothetical protein
VTRRWRAVGASLLWFAGLAGSILVLLDLDDGPLATPPVTDQAAFSNWLARRGGIVAGFALLRVAALAVAAYLVLVTLLGWAARVTRRPGLVRLATLSTAPALRTLLTSIAGVGLTASAATLAVGAHIGAGPSAIDQPAPEGLVLERLPDRSPMVIQRIDDDPDGGGTATMRVVPIEASAPPLPRSATTWVVEPGDSLWSRSASALSVAWGRPPTDAEITPYWLTMVEANRSQLADPANPDLIFVNQTFVLPALPPRP